jgi:hypothetical protein
VTRHHSCRVTPFGHPRIHARLTAPRGISQPPTSFIGSRCQGIHHAPFNTYKHKNQSYFQNCTNKHTTHTGQRIHSMLATTIQLPNTTPHHQDGATTPTITGPGVASGPNSVPAILVFQSEDNVVVHPAATHYRRTAPHGSHPHQLRVFFVVLLRKEVIQPHLPVRLPCYDFVPIADPTFDSSPHKG